MGVLQPAAINQAFADAYNARDAAAMLDLYADDGVVVNPDQSVATGHIEVAEHIGHLFAHGGTMSSVNQFSFVNGDTALVGARFELVFDDGRDPISGRTAEVLVKRGDEWVYLIDHPFAAPG
jgi:uncharacterized protein (TIGR02246 family)